MRKALSLTLLLIASLARAADLSYGNKYAMVTNANALKVDNSAVVQPVSGTFWQSIQPISGSVSISNWPISQAVTGTFWPTVQPVSGTFWQTTQPVSIATMPTTPVTGTFWQATQPISGSVSVSNFPATSSSAATVSRVVVGTTVVTLLVANPSRKRAIIFNESGTLRVKFGANASLTDYTYEIIASAGNNFYNVDNYTGIITGIKVSGASSVQVTEL